MGGSDAASGMDSGQSSAHDRDVGSGVDANALSASGISAASTAAVLRGGRVAATRAIDRARVFAGFAEGECAAASAPDGSHSRRAEDRTSGRLAASESDRPESSTDCRNAHGESGRAKAGEVLMQGGGLQRQNS